MRGRRLILVFVALALAGIAAVVGAAVLLGAAGGGRDSTSGRPGTVAVDPHAPRLRGTDPVTGATVRLSRVKDKPVLVHFWASWCGKCAQGAAALQRFVHRHRRDVVVLGVDYQDDAEDAKAFYEKHGWTFRSIADDRGLAAARFGVRNLPATVVLDENHLIVDRIEGKASTPRLEQALSEAAS